MTNSNTPYERAATDWWNLIDTFRSNLDEIDRLTQEIADMERLPHEWQRRNLDELSHRRYILRTAVWRTYVGFVSTWRMPNCIACWEATLPASVQRLGEDADYMRERHYWLPFVAAILRNALEDHDEQYQPLARAARERNIRLDEYEEATREDVIIFLTASSGFEAWSRIHP